MHRFHEILFRLRSFFCWRTREFLSQHPRGYEFEPVNPGLTVVLGPAGS